MVKSFGKGLVFSTALAFIFGTGLATSANADFTTAAYRLAVAEAAQSDKDLAKFYQENSYQPLWTGRNREDRERRDAFLAALETADFHGLPYSKYQVAALKQQVADAKNQADLAALEVTFSEAFLTFARDIQTGVLIPVDVDDDIVRKVPYRKRLSYLTSLEQSTPTAFFRALAPTSAEYARLAGETMRLRDIVASGGWGDDVPRGDLIG